MRLRSKRGRSSIRLRSFRGLGWRNLAARRTRAALTVCGIAVGIGLMFGTGLLTTTINSTFRGLFDAIYGRTDLVVSTASGSGSIKPGTLKRIRSQPGVRSAYGTLYQPVNRIRVRTISRPAIVGGPPVEAKVRRPTGEPLNLVGIDTRSPPPSNSRITDGRKPRKGRELSVESRWLRAQDLKVGDRLRLALPRGIESFSIVGAYRYRSGAGVPGQSFGTIPIGAARRGFERPRGFDEIAVVAEGSANTRAVQRRLRSVVGQGIVVDTPRARSETVLNQLDALKVVLTIMSVLGAFVGAFLIFNAFSMTVLERQRELGMLRAIGAGRRALTRSILLEALILGLIGIAFGLALGWGLGAGMVALAGRVGFPLTQLRFSEVALIASVAAGVLISIAGAMQPAWRAGRSSPLAAVEARREGRRRPKRLRAVLGVVLLLIGLASASSLTSGSVAGSAAVAQGAVSIGVLFLGVALLVPYVIRPLVRPIVAPLRSLFAVESRLAGNAVAANPMRSAVTATTLVVGLGLITAFGSISTSFLDSVSRDLNASAGRDLTVQPRSLDLTSPAPQQTFSPALRRRIARLPEADVVTAERFFFSNRLVEDKSGVAFGVDPEVYEQVDSSTYQDGLTQKQVLPKLAAGQVVVSDALARRVKLDRGERLRLKGSRSTRRVRVAAISRGVLFGGRQVQMSLRTMRELYGVKRDSRLAVEATSAGLRGRLTRKVNSILDRDYGQLQALSSRELQSEIDERLEQQVGLFNILLVIAVSTSLFGLTATIAMSVFERTREIGVLRALGCSRWQVRRAIAFESLVLALVGALLGNILGLVLGWLLVAALGTLLPSITYSLPLEALVAANIGALVLGLLASILPARRAARMDVTSALAYE